LILKAVVFDLARNKRGATRGASGKEKGGEKSEPDRPPAEGGKEQKRYNV